MGSGWHRVLLLLLLLALVAEPAATFMLAHRRGELLLLVLLQVWVTENGVASPGESAKDRHNLLRDIHRLDYYRWVVMGPALPALLLSGRHDQTSVLTCRLGVCGSVLVRVILPARA